MSPAHTHALALFSVSEAEATAIRDAFQQRGELAAAIELHRLFPGIADINQDGNAAHYRRLDAATAGEAEGTAVAAAR